MTRGKYTSKAANRRTETAVAQRDELVKELHSIKEQLADEQKALAELKREIDAKVLRRAREMAAEDLSAQQQRHEQQLEQSRAETARLLMYLVDVVAEANREHDVLPADLPGLLHHYSDRAGELFARAVNATDSQDPDIAVMASRRNRRADVHAYRAEASRRAQRGLGSDPVLTDPQAWLRRTRDYRQYLPRNRR